MTAEQTQRRGLSRPTQASEAPVEATSGLPPEIDEYQETDNLPSYIPPGAPLIPSSGSISIVEDDEPEEQHSGSVFDDAVLFDEVFKTGYWSFPVVRLINEGVFQSNDQKYLGKNIVVRIKDAKVRWVTRGLSPTKDGLIVATPETDIIFCNTEDNKPPKPDTITSEGLRYADVLEELESRVQEVEEPKRYIDMVVVVVEATEFAPDDDGNMKDKGPSDLVGRMVVLQIPPKAGAQRIAGFMQELRAKCIATHGKAGAAKAMENVKVKFLVGKKVEAGTKSFFPWDIKYAD